MQLEEESNKVIQVAISDSETWCRRYLGGGKWIKNTSEKRVGVNYIYYPEYNKFSSPKPYSSWILNNETFLWEPPTPIPSDYYENDNYIWNEETQTWDEISK